ncbi:MAG: hypothetical protein JW760_05865 [Spirochaetales bacterium]|nr:hypothetical protein [Spirochaetales bacterium]
MKGLVFVLPVILFLFSGCEKKAVPPLPETKSSEVAAGATPEEPDTAATPAAGPGTIQIERRDPSKTETREDPVLQVERNAGMEGFLSIRREDWVLPEDFVIGPLQSHRTDKNEEAAIMALSLNFFAALKEGVFPGDLVLEESRQNIKTFLDHYIANSTVPDAVRLGSFIIPGAAEGRCNIRLYKNDAVSSGEMYFRKITNTWYLEDLQVDLSLLEEPYQGRSEPYQPVVYRYLDTF